MSDDERRTAAADEGGGDRLLRPASNRGRPSQRQKTHTRKRSLSAVTGGSLYWSGPHSILPGGPPQLPSTPGGRPLQIYELNTAHIYQRRSNGRKLIVEVCQHAVPRIGLVVPKSYLAATSAADFKSTNLGTVQSIKCAPALGNGSGLLKVLRRLAPFFTLM